MKNTYTVVRINIETGAASRSSGIIGKAEAEAQAKYWRSRQYLTAVVKEPAK